VRTSEARLRSKSAAKIQAWFRQVRRLAAWRGGIRRALRARDWEEARSVITHATPDDLSYENFISMVDTASELNAPIEIFAALVDKYPLGAASVSGAARCKQWAIAGKLLEGPLPLKAEPWVWGKSEAGSMSVSAPGTIRKAKDNPDYSAALGSVGFETGTHTWEIQITEDARDCWLGVATHDLPLNKRASGLGASSTAQCWYWGSDGKFGCNKTCTRPAAVALVQPGDAGAQAKFKTNDTLRFTLDCAAGTLACHNVTAKRDAGVLVGITGKVFPFVCFDIQSSSAKIVRSGGDVQPEAGSCPGAAWKKGEPVLIHTPSTATSPSCTKYAHVVSATSAHKFRVAPGGKWQIHSRTSGGWIEAQLSENTLAFNIPDTFEAKDANGKWWPVELTSCGAEGEYTAVVDDKSKTVWRHCTLGTIQMRSTMKDSEVSEGTVLLGNAEKYEGKDKAGKWWPITITHRNTDGSATYVAKVHDGTFGGTEWGKVTLSNVRVQIPMMVSRSVQLTYTVEGKICSVSVPRSQVDRLKQNEPVPEAPAAPTTMWKNVGSNRNGIAIRTQPKECSKVDRSNATDPSNGAILPGDEFEVTECVPGDGNVQAYLKLAKPWKGLAGYVPLTLHGDGQVFDKILPDDESPTGEATGEGKKSLALQSTLDVPVAICWIRPNGMKKDMFTVPPYGIDNLAVYIGHTFKATTVEVQPRQLPDFTARSSVDSHVLRLDPLVSSEALPDAVEFEARFSPSPGGQITINDGSEAKASFGGSATSLVDAIMEPQTGMWSIDFQIGSSKSILLGLARAGMKTDSYLGNYSGGYSVYASDGKIKPNGGSFIVGSEKCCSGYSNNDVIRIQYNSDESEATFYKNDVPIHKQTDLPVAVYFFAAGGTSGSEAYIRRATRQSNAPQAADPSIACSSDWTVDVHYATVAGSVADGFKAAVARDASGLNLPLGEEEVPESSVIPCAASRGAQWIDECGRCLLHLAAINAAPVDLLRRIVLMHPPAVYIRDCNGSTPVDLAIAKGGQQFVDALAEFQAAVCTIQRAAIKMFKRHQNILAASTLLQTLCRRRLAVWPVGRTRSQQVVHGTKLSVDTFDVQVFVGGAPVASAPQIPTAHRRRQVLEEKFNVLPEANDDEVTMPDDDDSEQTQGEQWVTTQSRPSVGNYVRLKVSKEGLRPGDICVVSRDDKDGNPYKLTKVGEPKSELSYFTESMLEMVQPRPGGPHKCTLVNASSRLEKCNTWESGAYSTTPWESTGGKTGRGHWLDIKLSDHAVVTGVQICKGGKDSYAPSVVEIDSGSCIETLTKVGGGNMPTDSGWQDIPMATSFTASVLRLYIQCSGSNTRLHGFRITTRKPAQNSRKAHARALETRYLLNFELQRPAVPLSLVRVPRFTTTVGSRPAFSEIKRQRWAVIVFQKYVRRFIAPLEAERRVKHFAIARRTGALDTKLEERRRMVEASEVASKKLARRMGWDASMTRSYAELRHDLAETIGLDVVKKYVDQFEADSLGRHQVGEKILLRHVLVSGEFGTGKRTAARLIARSLGACSGIAKGSWTAAQMVDPLVSMQELLCGPSKWREAVEKDSTPVSSLDPPIKAQTVYFWRLEGNYDTRHRHVDSRIFAEITRLESVVIMAGTSKELEGVSSIDCFRRQEPRRLDLQTLGLVQLAKISLQLVRDEGYVLDVGNALGAERTSSALEAMKEIVRQKYDAALIVQRNGYLAADMLHLAKSRKNERVQMIQSTMPWLTPRMVLTAGDFGYDMVSKAELAEKLATVEAAVAAMVGWGAAKERRTAKHFFTEVRSRVEQAERDSTTLNDVLCHMVLTGNAGTGKRSFARLAHQCLRAHGALSKDSFISCSAAELRGTTPSKAAALVQRHFKQADGGCLLIENAHVLLADPGSEKSARMLDSSREVLQALVAEAEQHAGTTLVILSGLKESMAGLLRAQPGIDSRFGRKINISDFTSAEVSLLIERQAANHRRSLEPGLRPQLAKHIADRYGGDMGADDGNGRLARQLLDAAHGRMSERLAESWHKSAEAGADGALEPEPERPSTPESPTASIVDSPTGSMVDELHGSSTDMTSDNVSTDSWDSVSMSESLAVDNSTYIAADFGIGDALGATKDIQDEVDAAVAGMVGMTGVKDWFANLKDMVFSVEKTGDLTDLRWNLNMILVGNPGTGKTTLARLLHRFYFAHGVLPKDNFVERNVLDLKGETVGGTAPKVPPLSPPPPRHDLLHPLHAHIALAVLHSDISVPLARSDARPLARLTAATPPPPQGRGVRQRCSRWYTLSG
jgi:DNA polymerase III delta prime subunit